MQLRLGYWRQSSIERLIKKYEANQRKFQAAVEAADEKTDVLKAKERKVYNQRQVCELLMRKSKESKRRREKEERLLPISQQTITSFAKSSSTTVKAEI